MRTKLLLLFVFLISFFAYSQTTYTFDGSSSGNWSDVNNWSPSYPGSTILAGDTVNLDASVGVDLLLTNNGIININNGLSIVAGYGIVNNSTGAINNYGDLYVQITSYITNNGLILNEDFMYFEDLSWIDLNATSTLIDNGTIDFYTAINDNYVTNFGTVGGSNNYIDPSSFSNNGTLSPGNPIGVYNIQTNVNLFTSSNLDIEIGGTTAGTEYDQLLGNPFISGIGISGTLNVILQNGFEPQVGDSFTIISAASVGGNFTTTNLPSLPVDRQWSINYLSNSVELEVESTAATAFNFDGLDDYAAATNPSILDITSGTVEMRIKPETKATPQTILGYRSSDGSSTKYLFNLLGNLTGIGFWNGASYQTISYTFNPGEWYNIVITDDDTGSSTVYVNGVSIGAFPTEFGTASGSNLNLYVGVDFPLNEYFLGDIGDIRIWNTVKPGGTGICSNMPNGSDLLAYYDFNQGIENSDNSAITTINDSSGNSNNLSLINTTLSGLTSNWIDSDNASFADTVAPIAAAQNITASLDANGQIVIDPLLVDNGSTDNCGIVSYTLSQDTFTCDDLEFEGFSSQALDLDGTFQYAEIPFTPELNLQNSWTLEGWIYPTGFNPGGDVVIDKYSGTSFFDEYSIFHFGGNYFAEVTTSDGNFAVNGGPVTLNQWTHIAGVYDQVNGTLSIYINGVLQNTATGITGSSLSTTNKTILGGVDWGNATFTGTIDELRIWDRALTAQEIADQRSLILSSDEANLVGYFRIEQGPGNNTLLDSSPNNNTASFFNLDANSDWNTINTATVSGETGVLPVLLTVTDANGNADLAPAQITIIDNAGPNVITQDITLNIACGASVSITENDISNSITDNCQIASISIDNDTFDGSMIGTNTVTLTVTDTSGNTTSETAIVNVVNTTPIIYVDQNATGSGDGTTWANAFNTIQEAIHLINNTCTTVDEIHIAEGSYLEGSQLNINKAMTIKGSYPSGGGIQDFENNPTMIDGNEIHRVINASHTTGILFLEGITVQNGRVSDDGGGIYTSGDLDLNNVKILNNKAESTIFSSTINVTTNGGGIYANQANITLNNSTVNSNMISSLSGDASPFAYGGGIYITNGDITLTNSTVNDNTVFCNNSSSFIPQRSYSYGGGIYSVIGNTTLISSSVNNNSIINDTYTVAEEVGAGAAGIYNQLGNTTLLNSTINNNTITTNNSLASSSNATGCGIRADVIELINATLSNNTITTHSQNNGRIEGGAIYVTQSITMTNSLLSNNRISGPSSSSSIQGGAIFPFSFSSAVSVSSSNSILWNNEKSTDNGNTFSSSEYEGSGTFAFNHSLVTNQNPTGTNNIDATSPSFDPLFVDSANGDFRLQSGSPLIDAGNDSYLPQDTFDVDNDGDTTETLPLDLDGELRISGSFVDMGAYEFQNTTLGIDDISISKYSVYPNPTNQILNIEGLKTSENLEIYNISGQKLLTRTIDLNKNTIDVSQLSAGIYFLKITNESMKFIKY
ncbi:MAG: T9SS C-terminal target domain-containing protein [Winogradskyella sp.]|uniref:T9SS type A sorting domain-containing protein n=1 Tax=Winogradskyella sp. TaxID=1883156 RepID=UPI000F3E8B8F|nr:LamG-like jellyroll fold domain-containing protein [Winogradskyella sp.]RNC86406.1 MAG: T9SS C-terminal target domain-containing protein [Winogradskyella sp.]